MNHIIARALIAFLMNNPGMEADRIHCLLMVTEPLIHRKVLSEEEIELYCDQLENFVEI